MAGNTQPYYLIGCASISTIRNGQPPQNWDKQPQQYSPVLIAGLNPDPHCTTKPLFKGR